MNSMLPNLRLVCLESEQLGNDWLELAQEIDKQVYSQGMDILEESTFLLFSNSPNDVLNGYGKCLIARPVIGPKKELAPSFRLIDWDATECWEETIIGPSMTELLESAAKIQIKLASESKNLATPFIFKVRRSFNPALSLSVNVIFHE